MRRRRRHARRQRSRKRRRRLRTPRRKALRSKRRFSRRAPCGALNGGTAGRFPVRGCFCIPCAAKGVCRVQPSGQVYCRQEVKRLGRAAFRFLCAGAARLPPYCAKRASNAVKTVPERIAGRRKQRPARSAFPAQRERTARVRRASWRAAKPCRRKKRRERTLHRCGIA